MIKLREEDAKSGGKRKRGLIGKVIEMIFSYFFAWLGHRTCVNIARKEKKNRQIVQTAQYTIIRERKVVCPNIGLRTVNHCQIILV